ncbi:MAG TPA: SRPBCC family protein [Burkholderiales bacterium]|nr:SRPBCC family protein [Burkholderiales bacterium]
MADRTGGMERHGFTRAATCLGLGAAIMYMADPDRGARRRALARDRLTHTAHVVDNSARVTSRDVSNRARGLWAAGRHLLNRSHTSDEALVPRVRAQLGRVVSHPHAISASARDGHVTLSGPILAREMDPLLASICKVPGVKSIENQLAVYHEAGKVSALQGGRIRDGNRFELFQQNWSPTARLLTGIAGSVLALGILRRPAPLNIALAAAGVALLARATTNRDLASFVGITDNARGIEVQKTISVNAPIEEVFAFWTNYENFPRFMTNVLEVEALAGNRSHWVVCGPARTTIEWTAEMTAVVPNQLIEWRTLEGSMAKHCGTVRFDPNEFGGTRVSIKLTYLPLAGAIGHAVAKWFGADPKSEMDADLMRMKSMIETGHPPHDAAARRRARESLWTGPLPV